jgi:hypothetical protein
MMMTMSARAILQAEKRSTSRRVNAVSHRKEWTYLYTDCDAVEQVDVDIQTAAIQENTNNANKHAWPIQLRTFITAPAQRAVFSPPNRKINGASEQSTRERRFEDRTKRVPHEIQNTRISLRNLSPTSTVEMRKTYRT